MLQADATRAKAFFAYRIISACSLGEIYILGDWDLFPACSSIEGFSIRIHRISLSPMPVKLFHCVRSECNIGGFKSLTCKISIEVCGYK
jgi:hypothetical protein